jgi:hypothetical protein
MHPPYPAAAPCLAGALPRLPCPLS